MVNIACDDNGKNKDHVSNSKRTSNVCMHILKKHSSPAAGEPPIVIAPLSTFFIKSFAVPEAAKAVLSVLKNF